ncbi:MAG: RNA 3'-terminal phosphate cyclase [archaeon]
MIEIDGSFGEAGGQILRSALGFSAVTGKPFRMTNIRANRCTKGLQEQHLQGVIAMKKLCDAEVEGAELDSTEITFKPRKIKSGDLDVKIKTAGSVGLILQSLLIPAIKTDINIKIDGGATFGKWALPVEHLKNVVLKHLETMGYSIQIDIIKEGFYPKGGAKVRVHSGKGDLRPITILEKGNIISIEGISIASKSLENKEVANRQAKAAKKILFDKFKLDCKIKTQYVDSTCPGSGIQLWIKTENSVIGANALGERNVSSETVGEKAAKILIQEYEDGCVDKHTADQLLPYIALANGGKIKCSKITNHVKTNAKLIEKFMDVKFKFEDNVISL